MHLRIYSLLLFVLLAVAPKVHAETPLIFAAASTTNLMEAMIREYGRPIRASFASSSVLAKQISKGAPVGLFLSANKKWMGYLAEKGLLIEGTRQDLLANRLVVIAPKDAQIPAGQNASEVLRQYLGSGRLSVGDPNHVPAGIYAKQALESLGLWQDLKGRLAPMHHVRAALTLVERGESPLGIVYATDAMISQRVKVAAVFAPDTHQPITYQVALIKGKASKEVQDFFEFLTSSGHEELLARYSFTKP